MSCATIIYHPELRRVGQQRLLPHRERAFALSRNELTFNAPRGSAAPRALEDPYLSREPLEIRVTESGAMRLRVPTKHGAKLDGRPAEGEVSLSLEDLEHGAHLELSNRVVLLLHRTDAVAARDDHGLVGESSGLQWLRRAISNVADIDAAVLIRGETGVGKDRVARAIHTAGARGPYLSVNTATLNRATAASELFGHERGAFTDAHAAHDGLFARASGGTLFLDEIGELAPEVQGMLLRVLESGCVRPLGGTGERPVSTRVIAATDADLDRLAAEARFRPALLHRLESLQIRVPPLRERRGDIARLAVHFFEQELEALGHAHKLDLQHPKDRPWLHRRIMRRLVNFDWPGNVRQLRNVIRQIVIGSREHAVAELDAQLESTLGEEPPAPRREAGSVSGTRLLEALRQHGWAFGPAARALGINRTTFYRLVEKHPDVRKGTDLGRAELLASHAANAGGLDAMSRQLRVSRRAIRLRLNELGIEL